MNWKTKEEPLQWKNLSKDTNKAIKKFTVKGPVKTNHNSQNLCSLDPLCSLSKRYVCFPTAVIP